MANNNKQLLTNAELELMLILWSLGEGSVKDVLAELSPNRNMAYTTASTIIRILEKKKFLKSRKQGKGHIYVPSVTKDEYETRTLGHVVDTLFEKTPASLVARLVADNKLSEAEVEEILQLLKRSES